MDKCPTPTKRKLSKKSAMYEAQRLTSPNGPFPLARLRAYKCKCGSYHVGNVNRKPQRRKW